MSFEISELSIIQPSRSFKNSICWSCGTNGAPISHALQVPFESSVIPRPLWVLQDLIKSLIA
jgi:hypothetical protein